MKGKIWFVAACPLLLSLSGLARGADPTPEQVKIYTALAPRIDARLLRQHVERLASLPSRVTGYEGADSAADYVREQLESYGLKVAEERFPVSVPVNRSSTLKILNTGETIRLYAMWPNAVRTSQTPPEGITSPLIYAKQTELVDFNGKKVDGSTVLADFACGTRWLNAPRLGAKAVVFIEPKDLAERGEAETKYLSVPFDIPRFWIGRGDADRLLALLESRPDVRVQIRCKMDWRHRYGRNLIAVLRGSDPELRKQRIYITAYYDSMSVVPELAPGAEGACGIAAMLELARILTHERPARTVVFLATAGHFEALSGIRSYLGRHLYELERGVVRVRRARFLGLFPYHKHVRERLTINLFTALDLSSKTRRVGVFYKGWYYNYREDRQREFSDFARKFVENGEKISKALGWNKDDIVADGVNPIAGKPWRTFIPGKIALENEAFTLGGGRGVGFVTTDDVRNHVDTPHDQPDTVDFKSLREQVIFLACSYHEILNDKKMPLDEEPKFARMRLDGGFAILRGRVVEFDVREGIIPQKPVRGSLVIVRPGDWAGAKVGKVFRQAFMGVRGDMAMLVGPGGEFTFYGMPTINAYGFRKATFLEAFHTDPKTGSVDYAPDLGVQGNKAFSIEVYMTMGVKEASVVLFPCVSIAIFDIVDPQILLTLPDIHVYDAQTDAEPRAYGYSVPRPEYFVSYVEDVALVYAKPGSRVKITMELGPAARRFLLLNSSPQNPEGKGYLADRSKAIAHTPLRVANDMWMLDDMRMKRLARYRIVNQNLNNLHQSARENIRLAEKALARLDYAAYDGYARAAWGYESRAYPDVQATTDDVVKSSLFYLMLMLPFAFFLERLIFARPNLKSQIAVTVLIFAGIFVIFRFIHPAFDITMNPLVVLLAFIMMALSVLVIGLVTAKFEAQLKAIQTKISGVHRADIGRMGVAMSAFSLGISNMRRRRARTFFTCATLVLLTFTVLSFTSVVSTTRYNDRPSPGKPRYNGLMIRSPTWAPLEEGAFRLINNEFGKTQAVVKGRVITRTVVGRAWFYTSLSDEQSFIKLTCGKSEKAYNVRSAVGLMPGETKVTKIDSALIKGSRWFLPGERYACVIPTSVATTFNITPQDIGKLGIQFEGLDMRLVGIVDPRKVRNTRDLDNESLTPVDFIQMAKLQRAAQAQQAEAGFQEYLHLSADEVIFIPYDLAVTLGAKVQSVGVDFVTPDEVKRVLKELMPRLGFNLYAGLGDRIRRWSALGTTSITGLLDLVVPILIVALIVLNTMLGSVYERVREIEIFSAIGLAPSHIGTLFMAEAFVYAILGAIFGYLIGQGASKIITVARILPGLSLNYSSVSAVASTTIVIAVVLLSTLYPARKASEVATPAIERRWKVPDPSGDDWEIPLPFAVTGEQAAALNAFMTEWFKAYEEYSIGDFVTQNVQMTEIESERGKGYSLTFMCWLAPFDLGVSQRTELRTLPTAMEDVYQIRVLIHRESGDVASWRRVNRRFLNTLRKQFLIWRTLRAEERERYLAGETAPAS
jgi:hypothetical protein